MIALTDTFYFIQEYSKKTQEYSKYSRIILKTLKNDRCTPKVTDFLSRNIIN